jgi:teichuronic acid exporter
MVNKSFSFIIKIILARILFPEEFGLVGMAVVFISFVEIFNDIGIGAALIQRKDEDLRNEHFHTAFWTGIIWSILVFGLIIIFVSPFAAKFYNEPFLKKIIPVLSIGILSGPINLVHNAQLTRAMNFKKLAFINNFSSIFSGTLSLGLAYFGAGIWSLVFNSVSTFIIAMPLYFHATKWYPKMIWKRDAFNEVFGFGMFTTGTNFLNNLMNKLDYLLIGKLVSASALGNYTLAFVLTDTFRSQLMGIMGKVMYPVYGKLQDDKLSIKKYYKNVVKYNSILVFPIMLILFFNSKELILSFFGEKWFDSIFPLKVLSISVLFHMMVNSNTVVIRGMGKPKLEMKIQFWKSILLYVPLISIGVYFYGIVGASLAYLTIKILSVFIVQFYMKKLIEYTYSDLFHAIRISLISSLIASVPFIAFKYLFNMNLILCIFIFLILYLSAVYFIIGKDFFKRIKQFNFKTVL